MKQTSDEAFEIAIEAVLLGTGFDRERAIPPDEAPGFIHATQGTVWEKPEAMRA
jgi:hypothetical protein